MRGLRPSSKGFTVVELLIVVAIMLILSAMLWPVILQARGRALLVSCMSNLRQIHTAVTLYTQDNSDRYPVIDPSGNGWITAISPYASTDANIRHCPAGTPLSRLNYSVNPYRSGSLVAASDRADVSHIIWAGDGFENPTTGQVQPLFGSAATSFLKEVPGGISLRHGGQAVFVFLDGSAKSLKRTDLKLALLTGSSL